MSPEAIANPHRVTSMVAGWMKMTGWSEVPGGWQFIGDTYLLIVPNEVLAQRWDDRRPEAMVVYLRALIDAAREEHAKPRWSPRVHDDPKLSAWWDGLRGWAERSLSRGGSA